MASLIKKKSTTSTHPEVLNEVFSKGKITLDLL